MSSRQRTQSLGACRRARRQAALARAQSSSSPACQCPTARLPSKPSSRSMARCALLARALHAAGICSAAAALSQRYAAAVPSSLNSSFVAQVKSVTIFRDPRAGISKGCGLVAMATRQQAEAALAAVDQKLQLEVCSGHAGSPCSMQSFCSTTMHRTHIKPRGAARGRVQQRWRKAAVAPLRPAPCCMSGEGCGAEHALVQGSFSPVVVKWSSRGQKAAPARPPAVGEKRKADRDLGDPTNTEVSAVLHSSTGPG